MTALQKESLKKGWWQFWCGLPCGHIADKVLGERVPVQGVQSKDKQASQWGVRSVIPANQLGWWWPWLNHTYNSGKIQTSYNVLTWNFHSKCRQRGWIIWWPKCISCNVWAETYQWISHRGEKMISVPWLSQSSKDLHVGGGRGHLLMDILKICVITIGNTVICVDSLHRQMWNTDEAEWK